MTELIERWRAQMSRPHVIISEVREVGSMLATENERLRAALETTKRFVQSHEGDDDTAGFALGIIDAALEKKD